jgi:MerR family transcriptional regulator, aldehyde-responsive regulator
MSIGEVSKKYNLTIDTLRYYEKIGLLEKIKKVSGKREYQSSDLERLYFIICMKNAGLSLEEIQKFIEYYKSGDETYDKRLKILAEQKKLLTEEIEEKNKTLDYLNYKIDLYNKLKKGEDIKCPNH